MAEEEIEIPQLNEYPGTGRLQGGLFVARNAADGKDYYVPQNRLPLPSGQELLNECLEQGDNISLTLTPTGKVLISASGTGTTPVRTKLDTPTPPVVGTVTTTTIALGGDEVPNASGYRWQLATNNAFTTGLLTANTTASAYTFADLTADTAYYARRLALGSGNYSNSNYSTATPTRTAAGDNVGTVTPGPAQGSDSVTFTSATAS